MKIVKSKPVTCHACKGSGILKKHDKIESADINKMRKILKKNNLSRIQVSKLLKIPLYKLDHLFAPSQNKTGEIPKIYFDTLKLKGYLP